MNPFEIADVINKKASVESESMQELLREYNAFVINRVFSNVPDSIFFANEMNQNYNLPKEMQFAFYYHGLPKKSRYGKWHKNQDDSSELELIQEYFGYSRNKAKQIHSLVKPHLDSIRIELEKGGRKKNGTGRK